MVELGRPQAMEAEPPDDAARFSVTDMPEVLTCTRPSESMTEYVTAAVKLSWYTTYIFVLTC